MKSYGIKIERIATINMCGGCAEWWNYVLKFDNNSNFDLYHEDSSGLHFIDRNPDMYITDDEDVIMGDDIPDEIPDNWFLLDSEFFDY